MNDISEQRPTFFEGEYLGADDLQQIVIYLRDQIARHALGGHSWGIAAGLDLVEQKSPSGGVDVYLLPGYAVDGYGRAIIVVNPLRLTVDLFTGLASGAVPLWIRYDEGGSKGVRPGFEVCTAADAYARTAESYALKAGFLQGVSDRQDGIGVAGEQVDDPRTAPRLFNDNAGLLCDGSVPYQDLPLGDETKVWWIPLGLVGWSSGTPGSLRGLANDEPLLSRRNRRYLGVVAESVLAADGLIRLRRRETPWDAKAKDVDSQCGPDDLLDPSHDNDLQQCASGAVDFNELVWIEGRVRITDDTRLLGARLEFRDQKGTDYVSSGSQLGSVPLIVQRNDRNTNADLQVLLGAAQSGHNRFMVAQIANPKADPTDKCKAVTFDPPAARLVVQDDGRVGIGTETPDQMVDVEGPDKTFIHVRSNAGPRDMYVGAEAKAAVIAVLNDSDLRVRSGGTTPEDDTSTRLTLLSDGRIGIGTTDNADIQPGCLVTLQGESASYLVARTKPQSNPPMEVLVGADWTGAIVSAMTPNTDLQLRGGNNNTAVWIKDNANVGVGTSGPTERLEVNGNVRAQNFKMGDLYALGGVDSLRVIAGAVNSGGATTAGSGFQSSQPSSGVYHIQFDTPFPSAPVVVASAINASMDDDVPMVNNINQNGFDIRMADLTGNGDAAVLEPVGFSFVVFGVR